MTSGFPESSVLWSEGDNLGFLYVLAPIKWEMNAIESFVNDEMEDYGSLLNQANVGPLSVIAKALHRMGS